MATADGNTAPAAAGPPACPLPRHQPRPAWPWSAWRRGPATRARRWPGRRRQGHSAGDRDPLGGAATSDAHGVAGLLAQFGQGLGAELDLARLVSGLTPDGRGLHRAGLVLHAEHRDHPPVDGQLGEGVLGPGRNLGLTVQLPVQHLLPEGGVAAPGLDDDVRVPAVPGRVGRQPGQAGVEGDRGHHRGHRRHHGRHGRRHRGTCPPEPGSSRVLCPGRPRPFRAGLHGQPG